MTLACQPLVMLHGWGMNAAVWGGFAERLAAHRQVIPLDLPGHGDRAYAGESSLTDWALACLRAAPPRAIWLGWSLGAEVAQQAALAQPQRVAAVIALTGTPRFVQAEDWPHAMHAEILQQFITASREDHRKTLERFLALQVRGSDRAREVLRGLRQALAQRPDPRPAALHAGLQLLKQVDLRDQLPRLGCPTAWLFGERDTLVPASASADLARWLPEAERHVIPGAAHAPFLSHEKETLAVLSCLLERFDAN